LGGDAGRLPQSVALEQATLILRHDYQGALEEKIIRLTDRKLQVVAVKSEGSLLIPERYAALVGEVAQALGRSFPARAQEFQERADACRQRAAALAEGLQRHAQPWRGRRVIASVQQKQFSEWLGLEVVGELRRPEDTTPQDLEKLMALKVQAIVGNLQEGTQAAEALGQRLGVPVIVFSNFPGAEGYGKDYGELQQANLARLEVVWAKP
jgi:ABC-type Zn uptake system ZnuABC Zn-binding protein ZnuA